MKNDYIQDWGSKIFGGLGTQHLTFYCSFKNEFSKFVKIWTFRSAKIFQKNFKNFQTKFLMFWNSKKTIIWVLIFVQSHHTDQNLAEFSVKTSKSSNSPLNRHFLQFRRVRRRKFGDLGPIGKWFFGSWGPLWGKVLQKISDILQHSKLLSFALCFIETNYNSLKQE